MSRGTKRAASAITATALLGLVVLLACGACGGGDDTTFVPVDSGAPSDAAKPGDASDAMPEAADATPDVETPFVDDGGVRSVKVMVISMFGPEGQVWIDNLGLDEAITVRGLSPDYPAVHCNAQDVCNVITGEGHANAASSISALVYSKAFDLTKAYFIIAGIAGIDPGQGTLGSAAWARYIVDYGISWEIDAREMPAGWPYGYFGIMTTGPTQKPPLNYRTEVYQLDETLLQRALRVSHNVVLDDSDDAKAFRVRYAASPASDPPTVIQCDTASGDTWFAGTVLGQRAHDWVSLLTDGLGTYCTTEQEDNATFEVLKRASTLGKVNLTRVAVLRTASDFDRPYPGQTDADALLNYGAGGGFLPAISNLYKAGGPLVADILANWQ